MFDGLKLSMVVAVEALTEIAAKAAAEAVAEIAAEVLIKVTAEIASGTELKVLLIAVRCWDSLKSYTSFSA